MWRYAAKTWLVWACLTAVGMAQQIEIVVPDEELEAKRDYLIEVRNLATELLPGVTLIAEPAATTRAIGVTGWAGQQFIWFRANDVGRRFLVLALNGQTKPLLVSAFLDVGGTGPDPPPPPPPPGELCVIVVEESSARTAQEAIIYLGLQTYLDSKKVSWRIADKDQVDGLTNQPPKWLSPCLVAISQKQLSLPAIVVGVRAAEAGFSVAGVDTLPETLAKAIEWVKQYEQPAKPKRVSVYVPTPQHVVESILLIADLTPRDVVYDLGCGDGRVVVTAAEKYDCKAVGIEIDPGLCGEAQSASAAAGVDRLVSIRQGDLFDVDLSPATVVCVYLAAEDNAKLAPQLKRLGKGSRILSYAHEIPGVPPDKIYTTSASRIYLSYVPSIRYRLPGPSHSTGGCDCGAGMCVRPHLTGSHRVSSKMLSKVSRWAVYHDNLHNYAQGG